MSDPSREYDKPYASQNRGLRFDPTINAGHLLTFLGFILAGFVGWTTLDKRVLALEERHEAQKMRETAQREEQKARDTAQDLRSADKFVEIKETMVEIKRAVEQVRDSVGKKQ